MVTRTRRRRHPVARRIIAASLFATTGVGIVLVDGSTADAAEPCLDIGQVTYVPAPGLAPLTVPECAHRVASGCAEIVGSDGVAHPLGQPNVDIPPCRGTAGEGTPRRETVREPAFEQPAPRGPAGTTRRGEHEGETAAPETGRKLSFRELQAAKDRAAVTRRGGRYWSGTSAVPAGASQREQRMADESAARRARVTGGRS